MGSCHGGSAGGPWCKVSSVDGTAAEVISLRRENEELRRQLDKLAGSPSTRKYDDVDIDVFKTTEDLFSVAHFTGENADIRPLLDYTWHKKYEEARVELQDRLVEELCCKAGNRKDTLLLPWVVFTAGAMGAGKGHVAQWMDKKGYMHHNDFIVVDPDQIRQALPEWSLYVAKRADQAGVMTQKEAGHVAEILGYRALRQRWSVIFDGSLRDTTWYMSYFQKLRDQFPGIRLMILHIVADKAEVLKRAEKRGLETGRMVPQELLLESMEQVPKSVAKLAHSVDFTCRILNKTGCEPKLMREPGAPYPPAKVKVTWNLIKTLWDRLDKDGDGELSKEEVALALEQGLVTPAALRSIDLDNDGQISAKELQTAKERARKAGTKKYR